MPTILAGEQRVQGFETGLTGKLTDKWQIFAGYTYQDAKILNVPAFASAADLYSVGKQLPNVPLNALSFWTSYDLTPQLTVGGGVTYQSKAYGNTANTLYVPEFWKLDLMTSYKVTKEFDAAAQHLQSDGRIVLRPILPGHAVPAAGRPRC